MTHPWALLGAAGLRARLASRVRLASGATGRDLVPVLAATGLFEIAYAVLLAVGIALSERLTDRARQLLDAASVRQRVALVRGPPRRPGLARCLGRLVLGVLGRSSRPCALLLGPAGLDALGELPAELLAERPEHEEREHHRDRAARTSSSDCWSVLAQARAATAATGTPKKMRSRRTE